MSENNMDTSDKEKGQKTIWHREFRRALETGDMLAFTGLLRSFLGNFTYHQIREPEGHYQTVLQSIFLMCGYESQCERVLPAGRLDIALDTGNIIYVFELKLDGKVREASSQIRDKNYVRPFEGLGRPVMEVALNFSGKDRNLADYQILARYGCGQTD